MNTFYFELIIILSLTLGYYIESSSWLIRSLSNSGNIGQIVARTNIYLYGGRLLSVVTQITASFLVDKSISIKILIQTFSFGFIFVGITHLLLFNVKFLENISLKLIIRILNIKSLLNFNTKYNYQKEGDRNLYIASFFVTLMFSLALIIPFILCIYFPDYRLTLYNVGQGINFCGMIILLIYVDPKLFKALDNEILINKVNNYTRGRFLGFIVCGTLLSIYNVFI